MLALSLAEVQIAKVRHGAGILDADDAHFEGFARRIIADMQPKGRTYARIFGGRPAQHTR
jgi:hypothetical protein